MKIKVEIISEWRESSTKKGYVARAVFKDVDEFQKVFGLVVSKSSPALSGNVAEVRLIRWGWEEYQGHKHLSFMGSL